MIPACNITSQIYHPGSLVINFWALAVWAHRARRRGRLPSCPHGMPPPRGCGHVPGMPRAAAQQQQQQQQQRGTAQQASAGRGPGYPSSQSQGYMQRDGYPRAQAYEQRGGQPQGGGYPQSRAEPARAPAPTSPPAASAAKPSRPPRSPRCTQAASYGETQAPPVSLSKSRTAGVLPKQAP